MDVLIFLACLAILPYAARTVWRYFIKPPIVAASLAASLVAVVVTERRAERQEVKRAIAADMPRLLKQRDEQFKDQTMTWVVGGLAIAALGFVSYLIN